MGYSQSLMLLESVIEHFSHAKQLLSGQGKPSSLEELSKCPDVIINEIKRIRKVHSNLGKEKAYVFF